jgi:hypothetical protein
MADAADVRSLDAIREVRQALCAFEEDARNALLDVEFDIRRTREWLANEQRLYWQAEIRRWEQNLDVAKGDLVRKRLGRFLDRKPDTSQEEKAVRFAQDRLEHCRRKLELTRRWAVEFLRDMQEYQSQAQPLADMLDQDVARGRVRLDRMVEAIEAYARLAPPPVPAAAGAEGAAASMARPADPTPAAAPPDPDPADDDDEATAP